MIFLSALSSLLFSLSRSPLLFQGGRTRARSREQTDIEQKREEAGNTGTHTHAHRVGSIFSPGGWRKRFGAAQNVRRDAQSFFLPLTVE